MIPPTLDPHAQDWRLRTANDRFKAQAHARTAWSVVAATVAHASVLALGPGWVVFHTPRDPSAESREMAWISIADVPTGVIGASAAGVRVGDPEASSDAPDVGSSTQLSAWEVAGLSEALRDRLLRQSMPIPTITEPEPSSRDPFVANGAPTRMGGDPSAAELSELAEVDPLELDRLSSLRPELALLAPSTWILIRNRSEVTRFMETHFRDHSWDVGDAAMVSVAIWIDETGSVEWAEIHQSSGRAELDERAIEFFRDIVSFHPARDRGTRVPVSAIFWLSLPW